MRLETRVRQAKVAIVAVLTVLGVWLAGRYVVDWTSSEKSSTLVGERTRTTGAGEAAPAGQQSVNSPNAGPSPPPSGFPIAASYDGEAIWLSRSTDGTNLAELVLWKPATGSVESYKLPEPTLIFASDSKHSVIATPFGLLILGGQFVVAGRWEQDDARVVLFDAKNKITIGRLQIGRERPSLLVLRDKSVLVVGGRQTNAVERISFVASAISMVTGTLKIERLPDIPGDVRRGVGVVELSDGRVMALGGSSSEYVGLEPVTAETHILDLQARTWRAGPRMVEPRSYASATLLRDGGVMLAGGWTPKHTWNDMPTRSTERWDPRSDRFSSGADLALGVAEHQAKWVPGPQGRRLIVVGGMVKAWAGSNIVQEYDLAADLWRSTGESCPGRTNVVVKSGEVLAVPFSFGGRVYLWCMRAIDRSTGWSLVSLRGPSSGGAGLTRVDKAAGIALRRSGVAFLPPHENSPGLVAGGSIEGAQSAAVDAIWPDGRVQPLSSLNSIRTLAQVFRLKDGSILVAGGVSGDRTRSTQRVAPPELLPAGAGFDKAVWLPVDLGLEEGTALGQLADGALLAVKPDGNVERLIITGASQGKPAVRRSGLPPLNGSRRWAAGEHGAAVVVKELRDGRIVVAGGEERHRIAVLHERATQPDAPDRFVGIGDYTPSRTHEIYDPHAKAWRESAPSRSEGTHVAILDDGRVVKWGVVVADAAPVSEKSADQAEQTRAILEVSDTNGKSWRPFGAQGAPAITTDMIQRPARPFVVQGELFLFGMHLTDVTPNYARGNQVLQWFNTTRRRWETLWEAPEENWSDNLGRIVFRDLPNGKRVVLPVSE